MTTPMLAGVMGWPVEHSRSPAIHHAAADAAGVPLLYTRFPVRPGDAAKAVDAMRVLGLRGLSVTMPHKEAVMAAVDSLTPSALGLHAVNHLTNDDGVITGNNTDGDGFVRGFEYVAKSTVAGRRIVVVGSGGAARAVIEACARHDAEVVVVARSQERAVEAAALGGSGATVGSEADFERADVVVNATPVGMDGTDHAGQLPFSLDPLSDDTIVVDIVYHPLRTPLLEAAKRRNLVGIDGLAMLAGQAAEQFETWTGAKVSLDVLISAARRG